MSANFQVNASPYDQQGYVRITWDDSTKASGFYSWRVYRREPGDPWELLFETTSNASSFTFDDYLAPANTLVEYSIVQSTSGGSNESSHAPKSATPVGLHYWLIHPTDNSLSLLLYSVNTDQYEEHYEEEYIELIGRGRKLDQGERIGITGNLAAQLRHRGTVDAREQVRRLRDIKESLGFVWLRNPFGDVWKVGIGSPQFTRVPGVGIQEFVDFSIEYTEVA